VKIEERDSSLQAKEWNAEFMTTSAKTGLNITDLFQTVADMIQS
jgi:hypothetical protein